MNEDQMKLKKQLTKREIKKGARLFVLISMSYGVDHDGADGDIDREAMIKEVVRGARESLLKEFPTLEVPPMTQADCVAAIKGMRK